MELLQLLKKLPAYYKNSKVVKEILQSFVLECNTLNELVQKAEDDFFAILTENSINRWEEEFSLKPAPALTIDERRSRVLSRMKHEGVVTKDSLKRIVASYENGDIEVNENHSDYTITISFVSKIGIPTNIEDIRVVVDEFKPAHIAVTYVFTYRTWGEIKSKTWVQLKNSTWSDVLGGVI